MNKNLSVHLQNFPDVSFLNSDADLVADMDMVRQICSAALFIRDQKNLRVRLPLNTLNIIGRKASQMLQYKDIIADEVNVKNIKITPEIGDLAELKLSNKNCSIDTYTTFGGHKTQFLNAPFNVTIN